MTRASTPQPSEPAAWQVRLAAVSRPALLRLQGMPRSFLLVATMALLVVGLAVPGPAGGVALVVLGLFLLWLALLAWSALGTFGRVGRVAVAVLVLGYGAAKTVGVV